AKFIGLLSVSGLWMYALAALWTHRSEITTRSFTGPLRPLLALSIGAALPLVLWEAIQFVTLVNVAGLDAYERHLQQRWQFVLVWMGWFANTVWFVGIAKTGWVRHYWFGLVLAAILTPVSVVSFVRTAEPRAWFHGNASNSTRFRTSSFPIVGILMLMLLLW